MTIRKELSKKLELPELQIVLFCINASKKYRVYSIPKRKVGRRIIAQPTKELKKYQRVLVEILQPYLKVHECAYAYKTDISIKDNAEQHRRNTYILKMDFQNFFNKIKPELFFSKVDSVSIKLSREDRSLLMDILFWKPGSKRSTALVLSVGAPSSPFISNFIMFDFDKAIFEYCKNIGVTYTRYADDLTFSTNKKDVLFGVPVVVKAALSALAPGMIINDSKTVFSSKAHNRHVTGVTISNEGELSLGRSKKRYISSLIHKYSLGMLPDSEIDYLRGLLSYAQHIEPMFLTRLKNKYGEKLINHIRSGA